MRKMSVMLAIFCFVLAIPVLVFAQDSVEKDGDRELFEDGTEDGEEDNNGNTAVDGDGNGTTSTDDSSIDAEDQGMFEIVSQTGVQSVLNGTIPLTIQILPKITSSKAEIVWEVPRGLSSSNDTDLWFSMEENVPRSFRIDVLPENAGRYVVVADVTAWRYDTNYVASAEYEFEIDEALRITPVQPEYSRNMMIFTIAKVVGVGVIGVALFFGVKFGIRMYKKWMATD